MDSKANNKKRKLKITIFLTALIIIAGAYLWYSNREMQGSMQDYKIIMSSEGTMIENKKAGFSFKAPSGWEVGIVEGIQGAAMFALPGTEGANGTSGINSDTPLLSGCLIEATTAYNSNVSFEELEMELEEFRYVFSGADSCEFEMSEVNGIGYLRNYYTSLYVGPGLSAHFINSDNVYSFCLCLPAEISEEQERQCISDFDEFLETIVIE